MRELAREKSKGSVPSSKYSRHVGETLSRLEESDLDMWMNIAEAMNSAPYHVSTALLSTAHRVDDSTC